MIMIFMTVMVPVAFIWLGLVVMVVLAIKWKLRKRQNGCKNLDVLPRKKVCVKLFKKCKSKDSVYIF